MIYRDGWDKSKDRYKAFWLGEIIDRCCCSIIAPRGKPLYTHPRPRTAKDLVEKWTDPEFRLEQALYSFNLTYFGGDAFPMFWNNLGPGVAAAFMGAGWRLAEDTVWFDVEPPIKDWVKRPIIKLDTDSALWKATWKMTELFSKNAGEDFLVGITDLGGSMDIAASLRGSDMLLYDLYDSPDEIKALISDIDKAWKQAYDRLQGLINQYIQGTCAWMGIWCKERWYPLQCDFSAMISKKMFDEFVKPVLAMEAGWFDHAIYHLDGPGEIVHLDSILDIEGIDGIQCVPGAMYHKSTGEFFHSFCNKLWLPVLKKIQKQGKRLVLTKVHTSEINTLMEYLSPKGLFISMNCKDEEEVMALEKKIERWEFL